MRSKGPVDDLDFPVPRFFDGEVEIDTPFIPDISEGVSGVFVSERALFLVGVFGVLITGNGMTGAKSNLEHVIVSRVLVWTEPVCFLSKLFSR